MQNLDIHYKPIEVDFSVPLKHERNRYGKWRLLLMRISKIIGFYRDFTYVNQMNEQLSVRTEFPYNEWKKDFDNVENIEKVLKESSLDSCKINHNWIPSDLLLYVIWCDVEGNVADFMVSDIKKAGIGLCTKQEVMQMAAKKYTLKEFFKTIMKSRAAIAKTGDNI